MLQIPTVTLNSGHNIPQLGFGLYKVDPAEAERVASDALELGYRHLDSAAFYENEAAVGKAIQQSGIARDELFITTKVWNADHGRQKTLDAFSLSLDKLGLDYVDLYLIHWPMPENGLYLETWNAIEEIAASGLTRSIGVSNFAHEHLQTLIDAGATVPAVNQVELHPLFQQKPLRAFQEPLGIHTECWGPLGQGRYDLNELPGLADIAAKYEKSAHQVTIRWHLQEGIIVFPKTMSRERAAQNLDVFDFELTQEEMETIRRLDENRRLGRDPNNWGQQ